MPRIPNAQLHYERKRGYSANQMIELGPERVRKKEKAAAIPLNFTGKRMDGEFYSVPVMASFLPGMKNVAVRSVYMWPRSHYNDL